MIVSLFAVLAITVFAPCRVDAFSVSTNKPSTPSPAKEDASPQKDALTQTGFEKEEVYELPKTTFSNPDEDENVAVIPWYDMVDEATNKKRTVWAPDAVWMTGAPQLWAEKIFGEGVTVGVIDSGIDSTHPNLQSRFEGRRDYITWEDDTHPTQFQYHGTHVAGSIAANPRADAPKQIVGVAPMAKLRDYRVFDKEGRIYNPNDRRQVVSLARAVRDAVADGCHVINMSLGGGFPDFETQRAIQEARRLGVAVIVAAGNEGEGARSYPAAFPETLSVAAVNIKLPGGQVEKVWFSNTDSEVDVAADGYFLYSTMPGKKYGAISGTSMATPCVAGMAALLRQKMLERFRNDGKAGLMDIHDLLRHCGVSVFDTDGKERNEIAGHGVCTFFSEIPAVMMDEGQWYLPDLNKHPYKSPNDI